MASFWLSFAINNTHTLLRYWFLVVLQVKWRRPRPNYNRTKLQRASDIRQTVSPNLNRAMPITIESSIVSPVLLPRTCLVMFSSSLDKKAIVLFDTTQFTSS